MQFTNDSPVYTADNHKAGSVSRVVLDPVNKQITHIVVEKGTLFPEDRLIPIEAIERASADKVILKIDSHQVDTLPRFDETYYVKPSEEIDTGTTTYSVPPLYPYPPVNNMFSMGVYEAIPWPPVPHFEGVESSIPQGTVALKEGSRVISTDDQTIGTLDKVIADGQTGEATHLLVVQGVVTKTKKVIPVTWIRDIEGDEVRLAVSASVVENLEESEL